jgi:hypothetical protein
VNEAKTESNQHGERSGRSIGTHLLCFALWSGFWAAILCLIPGTILFPIGLFAEFTLPPDSIGFERAIHRFMVLGWIFYIGYSFLLFYVRRPQSKAIAYSILILVLVANIAGCRRQLHHGL